MTLDFSVHVRANQIYNARELSAYPNSQQLALRKRHVESVCSKTQGEGEAKNSSALRDDDRRGDHVAQRAKRLVAPIDHKIHQRQLHGRRQRIDSDQTRSETLRRERHARPNERHRSVRVLPIAQIGQERRAGETKAVAAKDDEDDNGWPRQETETGGEEKARRHRRSDGRREESSRTTQGSDDEEVDDNDGRR